ncbi:lytic transglycosylase domain-containing protein [Marinospirillum perlucidum]|uniref:lytic transglycosylase domain-containing protein n=1 Tax=Marinospirillum perlucidum TaxID=1982602 RepID=UPI000DF3613C|nr:lytic transglycosylase domain-containing protein [Marinospirillum perlucidum]
MATQDRFPSFAFLSHLLRKSRLFLVLLLLFFSCISTSSAFFGQPLSSEMSLAEKRQLFSDTYEQLKRGQLPELSDTLVRLNNYPLTPYLEYQLFRNQVAYGQVDEQALTAFLKHHPDTAFQNQLETEWLEYLGSQEAWEAFYQYAGQQPQTQARLECYRLRAQADQQGQSLSWLEAAAEFWRQHQPLPAACAPLVEQLQLLGFLTEEDYWQAALTLMRAKNSRQAWSLRHQLADHQRNFLDFWRRGRLNPDYRLTALAEERIQLPPAPDYLREELLNDLLLRLASRQPRKAENLAQRLYQQEMLSQELVYAIQEERAVRSAWDLDANTLELFQRLPVEHRSSRGREWYARTLVRLGNWAPLVAAIEALPPALQEDNEWRYWLGRALLENGHNLRARNLLGQLAQVRSYYGFLAAKELGQPPQMNARPLPLIAASMQELTDRPGIQRAGELYLTGYIEEARREWHFTLRDADATSWRQAAWLARHWGWHDRSVDAVHRAGDDDALELRFPLAHLEQIQPLAEEAELDLALVLALIRKESLFNPQARSAVGALGLMQVMPQTGAQVSRQLQLPLQPERDLLRPEYNLPVGISYLGQLMQRYENNPILAAAAYNAGPARTNLWQQQLGETTSPRWVEQITYAETRNYVKSILAFREVYAWRLQQQRQQLQLAQGDNRQPEG